MKDAAKALYSLITQVRQTFHDLAASGDSLYADLGVTASRRALLEYLSDHGPETVANIARAKNVSRQHIQQIADQAVAAGHAAFAPNPAHKRSQLVQLTDVGHRIFAEIRRREADLLIRLGEGFRHEDLAAAEDILKRLRERLAGLDTRDN